MLAPPDTEQGRIIRSAKTRMRAAVAAAIAVPLVAAGLFIAPSALAAPEAPSFDAASYTVEIDGAMELDLTGTVNPDSLGYPIFWYLDGATLCGFPADPDGTWECYRSSIGSYIDPLEPGHHTITAELDVAGTLYPSSVPLRVVYPAPTVSVGSLDLTAELDDTVALTGTGVGFAYSQDLDSEVAVLPVGDLDATPLCTAAVQTDNTFSCLVERDKMTSPSGVYAVYQYDAGHLSVPSFDESLVSDPSTFINIFTEPHKIKAPTPVITSPSMWQSFSGDPSFALTVSGTGGLASDVDHAVVIRVEYSPHGADTWSTFCDEFPVTADAWSCTGPAGLAHGNYDFRPFQLNPGEDPNHGGVVSATIGVSTPVWPQAWLDLGGLINLESDTPTYLQGYADVGSTVVVEIDGTQVCSTVAYAMPALPEPPFGFFYCDPFLPAADYGITPGHYTATATANVGTDFSNSSDLNVWFRYPAPSATATVNGESTGWDVTGVAFDLDATVAVYPEGSVGGSPLCIAEADAGDTAYTCEIIDPDLSANPAGNFVAVQYPTTLGGPDWDYSDPSTPFALSAYDIQAPAPQFIFPTAYSYVFDDEQPVTITGDHGLVSTAEDTVSLEVYYYGPDETSGTLCSIASVTNYNWSCEAEVLPPGSYELYAVQYINDDESDLYDWIPIEVVPSILPAGSPPVWDDSEYNVLVTETPQLHGRAAPGEWVRVTIGGIVFCDDEVGLESGLWSCDGEVPNPFQAGLGAGIWDAEAVSYVPDEDFSAPATVPFSVTYPAPTITSFTPNPNGFTIFGSGWNDTDAASVAIFRQGNPSGTPLCTAILDYTGYFSCSIVNPDLSAHPTALYAAYQFPTSAPPGGFDYSEPSDAIPLSAYDIRAPRPNITTPSAGQNLPLANQPIRVRGTSGLPSGELHVGITVTYSGPSSGTFCTVTTVTGYNWSCVHSGLLEPGTYTLTAIQSTQNRPASLPATRTFTVLPAPLPRIAAPTPEPTPTESATPEPTESPLPTLPEEETPPSAGGPSGSGSGGPLAPTDRALPGAPSLLTNALITPVELVASPEALAAGTVTAFALVVVIIIASEFFGEALSIQYALFTAFMLRRPRIALITDRATKWVTGHRVLTGLGLVLVTATVFSFADPGFGLDLTSIRLMLSCAISIIMINFVSNLLTEGVSSRLWGIPSRLVLMPWGLLVAVLGVLASRALDFSPGFLVGAILGLAVLGDPGPKLESRVIMLNFGITWSIAVGAWLLVGAVPVLDSSDPASFWSTLASDSLVATASAGLTALFVMLLPFKLLDGGTLLAYSRWRWVLAFGSTCLAFAMVVLPNAVGWSTDASKFGPWLITAGIFVAISVAAYVVARVRKFSAKEA